MTQKIELQLEEWENPENQLNCCRELEKGNILFLHSPPFPLPLHELEFLLSKQESATKHVKNVSYSLVSDQISHLDTDRASSKMLKQILVNYGQKVTHFLSRLLSPYSKKWQPESVSFRPF